MNHTAGVPSLDPSVELVVGRGEADDFAQHVGFGHIPSDARLVELDFRSAARMPYVGPAIDVFGDGSVWAISTPAHSLGHASFLVNATSGPVLLTGDAAHFRWAFEHAAPPRAPNAELATAARQSLDHLRTFAAHYPQVTVFTGHEAPAPRAEN